MKLPPSMKESAKHLALSRTTSIVPNLRARPEATRSPELVSDPVRIETPDATAEGPTVGANCRGFGATDAMGWLTKRGRLGGVGAGGGIARLRATELGQHDLPRFGALDSEVTPLLLPS